MTEHISFWKRHEKALIIAGVSPSQTKEILEKFQREASANVPINVKQEIINYLSSDILNSCTQDYIFWLTCFEKRIPISILLMGATGVGKTDIASELAEKIYGAVHVPIDMARNILRYYLPKDKYPLFWSSSYNAFEQNLNSEKNKNEVINAYLEQNQMLLPMVLAVIKWGQFIGRPTIIEGVNLDYASIKHEISSKKTCVFPFLIISNDEQAHWSYIEKRDAYEVLNRWRTLGLPIMPPVPVSFHTSLHIQPG